MSERSTSQTQAEQRGAPKFVVPDGWRLTGEVRKPENGEWFLCEVLGEWSAVQGVNERDWIVRPILARSAGETGDTKGGTDA